LRVFTPGNISKTSPTDTVPENSRENDVRSLPEWSGAFQVLQGSMIASSHPFGLVSR